LLCQVLAKKGKGKGMLRQSAGVAGTPGVPGLGGTAQMVSFTEWSGCGRSTVEDSNHSLQLVSQHD
jgi:hypothetical protein